MQNQKKSLDDVTDMFYMKKGGFCEDTQNRIEYNRVLSK